MTTPDDGIPRPPRRTRRGPQPLPSSDVDDTQSTFRPTPGPTPGSSPRRSRIPEDERNPIDASEMPRSRRAAPSGRASWMERIVFGSVRSTDLATFCRQLAGYLDAGVDLLRALGALEKQFRATALGPVIARLQTSIRRGDSVSEAMNREPRTFDRMMRSMMQVAEARGGMPEVLKQLSRNYENRVRLFRKARSAMIYPVSVILIAAGVGWLLTVFVLPQFVEILQDMTRGRVDLPAPTRALVALSNFMQGVGWWLVPVLAVAVVFGAIRAYRTSTGKELMDRLALRLPVLGSLMRTLDTTRFARTLSTLLEAGVDYDTSLRLTSEVLHAAPIRRSVDRARAEVMAGTELSEVLDRTHQFNVDVIQVLSSGEETGKLPEALEHLADDYEEQAERMVSNLGQLVQPILTIGIGGIVFFIVVAFVMAYISVITNLASGM